MITMIDAKVVPVSTGEITIRMISVTIMKTNDLINIEMFVLNVS